MQQLAPLERDDAATRASTAVTMQQLAPLERDDAATRASTAVTMHQFGVVAPSGFDNILYFSQ